jgi:alanyl-tRNA synthetase
MRLLEELAELKATELLSQHGRDANTVISEVFRDKDTAFIKLLGQKLTKHNGVVALLGSSQGSPALVFARSADVTGDMGALLRELVTAAGGRGGGGKDFAQGGVPQQEQLESMLKQAKSQLFG